MNKVIPAVFFFALVLPFVLLNLGQNAHSASSALTEPPADMSGINEMHKVLLKKIAKLDLELMLIQKLLPLVQKKEVSLDLNPTKVSTR